MSHSATNAHVEPELGQRHHQDDGRQRGIFNVTTAAAGCVYGHTMCSPPHAHQPAIAIHIFRKMRQSPYASIMETRVHITISRQPDQTTCGPACLHSVYGYFGDDIPLDSVIRETRSLQGGGTVAVFLANHALQRGYAASIYTYNLTVFDPTWFPAEPKDVRARLARQLRYKRRPKLHTMTQGYLEFLERGGRLHFTDLTPRLLRSILRRGLPILAGLSATYLYRTPREYGPTDAYDDIRGHPAGHFVILSGVDRKRREVLVSDPLLPNPVSGTPEYCVDIYRVINAILLGILTDDANLLVIQPRQNS